MATVGTDLYANILANPDDTGLKLIYADWLEENGQEDRAEFIRNSKKMIWERDATRNYPRWRWRHCKGDDESIDGWIGAPVKYTRILRRDINQHLRSKCDKIIYRNGFISEVHCNMLNFIEHGWKVFANHPVAKVVLTGKKPRQLDYGFVFFRAAMTIATSRNLDQEEGQGRRYTDLYNFGNKSLIDQEIFRHIDVKGPRLIWTKQGDLISNHTESKATFPAEQSALDALSDACIRYAKKKQETTT